MSFPLSIIPREKFHEHPLLSRLLELHDVPEILYVAGELPKVILDEYGRATPRILTVIGSRKNTNYGKSCVERLINSIRNENVIILSGLAYGIDSLAHSTALKNNLITVAIPGSGLDSNVIYPKSHLSLAEEIVEKNGALISELDPKTSAAQWTFPSRNRIMAALSDALLVVEAEEKSGTLITARQALELGRDIGAVPGDIFSPTSSGTNLLIRDGAYTVTNSDDLYALLHLSKKENNSVDESIKDYSPNEQLIMNILTEPMEKDLLLLKINISLSEFLVALSSLEMRGVVEEIFGEVRKIV